MYEEGSSNFITDNKSNFNTFVTENFVELSDDISYQLKFNSFLCSFVQFFLYTYKSRNLPDTTP